jgi:hypothetical protein
MRGAIPKSKIRPIKCFVAVSPYGISPCGAAFTAGEVRKKLAKTYPGGWPAALAKGWRVHRATISIAQSES